MRSAGRASIKQRGRPRPRGGAWCGAARTQSGGRGVGGGGGWGSHQPPAPRRSRPPARILVSRPVLAPGLCGPLAEHFAGPRAPRPTSGSSVLFGVRGRVLCGFADRCVSLWWVPRLPVSPPAAPSTSHPSRSSSRRTPARPRPLSPLWEAPGIPNGAGHPPLSPRRPSPHHWPCPADPVPAAESGGDGPLCPQDSQAHCPTSRPSHGTPSPWRSPPSASLPGHRLQEDLSDLPTPGAGGGAERAQLLSCGSSW